MGRRTSFTVVIPTHNGRPSITGAVASVLAQSHPGFELVVVCDGDGSRTRAMLADVLDPRLRIVEQPRSGVSRARNRGVSSARYDWITFLDDDDTARANWLETWSTHIEEDTVAVTARLAFWEGDHLAEERDCRLSLGDPTMDASSILPGGFALRRDLFASVGGFDESLTYSENQDLGLRLLDRLRVAGEASIVHVAEVLVDFHREAASARAKRYQSAPAQSARIFLSRYDRRLAHDRATRASLMRIISRAERHEGRTRAAMSFSMRACRIEPSSWANYRSLVLAVLWAPVSALARMRLLRGPK